MQPGMPHLERCLDLPLAPVVQVSPLDTLPLASEGGDIGEAQREHVTLQIVNNIGQQLWQRGVGVARKLMLVTSSIVAA